MIRRHVLPLFLLVVAFAGASVAHAQSVRWEPAGGTLAVGQTTELSLIFVDCEPQGEITLPALPGINVGRPNRGEQSSFNIVNGQASRTRTVYLTYSILPTSKTPLEIPSFSVETDKGELTVPAVSFRVGDATVGGTSMPLESAANSRLTVGEGTAWAGQVVPVNYTLSVTNRFPANIGSNPDWNAAPLVLEEWSQPEPFNSVVNGETRNNVLYKSRGYIREPGTYTLGALNQLVNLRVPSSGFSIFQSFQAEQFNITSNRPSIVVRPLPQPAPSSFAGAVGDFKLVSKVVPETATISEPVTWTLELSGTGNWPDVTGLPAREASRDFRVVQPQAKRTQADGALFEASLSEDVVLIPTKPGSYTLGPVAWTYFDPVSGTYKTLTTERITVTVTPSESDPVASAPPVPAPSTTTPISTPPPPAPPATPAPIPLDPLPGLAESAVPLSRTGLIVLVAASVAWVPLLWLGLALQRARQRDPWKRRREARAELVRTLAALRASRDTASTARLLRVWQQQTAALWAINRAAPTSNAFAEAPEWARLWVEAESCLFGPDPTLPSDWVNRAEAALSARRVPGFSPASVFLPRNLLPFVASFALLAATPLGGADAGAVAYGRSEFAVAEKVWREAPSQRPTDWIAHHNLALALAQQDRWSEAAGHATAAFVQNPSHSSVRWHFDLALTRAGYAPPALAAFAQARPVHRLARLFSPAGWQWILGGAGLLLGLAAALALIHLYGHAPRWAPTAAALCVMLALVTGTTALVSLQRYGLAKDPRAAVVWHATTLRSIPTEADTAQKTSPLAAGSLAIVERTFLGWIRLGFPNGQTGWVRHEDVVRLYR